mmetsp:Transcript_59786/g.142690  ORF Transcript_59786/g.142690 Transcript_59786/m.142690 type:complete len:213 (-) Transcript_59786:564-1202(-)
MSSTVQPRLSPRPHEAVGALDVGALPRGPGSGPSPRPCDRKNRGRSAAAHEAVASGQEQHPVRATGQSAFSWQHCSKGARRMRGGLRSSLRRHGPGCRGAISQVSDAGAAAIAGLVATLSNAALACLQPGCEACTDDKSCSSCGAAACRDISAEAKILLGAARPQHAGTRSQCKGFLTADAALRGAAGAGTSRNTSPVFWWTTSVCTPGDGF